MKVSQFWLSLGLWSVGLVWLQVVGEFRLWFVAVIGAALGFNLICQWSSTRANADVVVSYWLDVGLGSFVLICLALITPALTGVNLCLTDTGLKVLAGLLILGGGALAALLGLSLVRLWLLATEHQIIKDALLDLERRS